MSRSDSGGEGRQSFAQDADRTLAGTSTGRQTDDPAMHFAKQPSKSKSPPIKPCLSNLPDKVIHNIIKIIRLDYLTEDWRIYQSKWARMEEVFDRATDGSPCSYPLHEPHILTTVQSLAAVNQKLYRVCRPLLWETIRFPTGLPIPVHTWIELILQRHGHLVKCLDIALSADCAKRRSNSKKDSSCDNTIVWGLGAESSLEEPNNYAMSQSITRLSCDSVEQIISHCPQLRSLKLSWRWMLGRKYPSGVQNFLIPLSTRLSDLREIDLSVMKGKISYGGMTRIIKNLPLLESVNLSGIGTTDENHGPKYLLGCSLGELKYLSRLSLQDMSTVSSTWCFCPWSQTITKLQIDLCPTLPTGHTLRLISALAPRITHLQLTHPFRELRNQKGTTFDWPTDFKCDFSELAYLDIHTAEGLDILSNFKECKNIVALKYHNISPSVWTSVEEQILTLTWPRLKFINLYRSLSERGRDMPVEISENRLCNFCKIHGIRLYTRL